MTIHEVCGYMAELIMKEAMARESLDNLSVVFIAFKNFQKYVDMFQQSMVNRIHSDEYKQQVERRHSNRMDEQQVGSSMNEPQMKRQFDSNRNFKTIGNQMIMGSNFNHQYVGANPYLIPKYTTQHSPKEIKANQKVENRYQ